MNGLLHIYIGDGKGKTTAALGLALRASGAGMHVLYCQFLKSETSSELDALALLPNITVLKGEPTDGFLFFMNDERRSMALKNAQARLDMVNSHMKSGEYDLVVLDEFLWLLDTDLMPIERAYTFVSSRSPSCELILTGGHAPDELIALADYVSDVQMIKHPFDNDVPARRGIEF